ncbi:MAG: ParA family protein [Phycisphaerae bacterium]|nr:ParA family protein [Phycisphaerae bacterium]
MRRIAIINQKGGVGKTTTTVNLGSAMARRGQRVVLLDMDPQAHLTMHFGHEPNPQSPNIYQVLAGSSTLEQILKPAGENILVGAANIDLAAAEIELASVVGREVILHDAIQEYPCPYDYLLMDCPPSLGILTINALSAANEVFITLQPHFLALQGMGKLLETIHLVSRRINRELKVTGIVLCLYEKGTRLANEVVADMENFFEQSRSQNTPWANAVIFKTRIRRNIKLAEAPSYGQNIFSYAPESNGAEDYNALADEVLSMNMVLPEIESESKSPGDSINGTISETDVSDESHHGAVSDTAVDADASSASRSDSGSAGQG